jgi:CRISPR/Cas system-associated exonuclease Cas4 (RecB family)
MASEWRESEAGSERFRLFEHEYAVPVEQDDKRVAVGTVMRSLRHFFRSEILAEALAAGPQARLSLEDLASFHVDDVDVLLRMDLAFRRRDGRVVIVDWKTGRKEGRFNEVQVACYALFAMERDWARSPEGIETQLAYLAFPRTTARRVTGATLDRTRAFVSRSAGEMRALLSDVARNTAREADFSRIDNPRICRWCNFRRLCFPRTAESPPEEGAATRLGGD